MQTGVFVSDNLDIMITDSLKATLFLLLTFLTPSTILADAGSASVDTREGDSAVSSDSVPARQLSEVIVTAVNPDKETIPVQTLSGEELSRLNSHSVADALRYFAGVQIKDYGGVGGIKTVNIRSMGTNHTGVVYDGVQLGNAQNGQIDLGQFSLDNIEMISLHNGQKSALLQPARDFGNAGTVYMRTRTPHFEEGESYHARAALRFGSFDLLNPSALVELRLSDRINASLGAEWTNSSGKYKFRYRRVNPAGELAYDTTAVRQNGDINATRLELNVNGTFGIGNWHAKVYNYNSERGVPGAIVNNVWRRGERIWDTNSFAQASATITKGCWTSMENLKYAFYRTHYVNNDDKQIKVDNLYRQKELYFSTANLFSIKPWWHASASYDFIFNSLNADVYGFAKPDRYTNLLSVATAFDFHRVSVTASGLMTFVHDILQGQEAPKDKSVFTPAVYVTVFPLRNRELSLRAFYKKSFRMPTFNDLYYADMGNSKLNPERVAQYNVGILFDKNFNRLVNQFRISCDVYYNKVHDKIVAYPKGQQFRWTMLNLGVVDIRGIDVSALLTFNPIRATYITFRGQYTYQKAIDITNPSDNYYCHQIPYIPHHSGSAVINATWRNFGLNYSFIYVGSRYNQQENIRYNYTQPWYTSDVSLLYDLKIKRVAMRFMAEVNNLLSQDYDVILNYPMPKRNYRFSITVEL